MREGMELTGPLWFFERKKKVWRYPFLLGKYEVGNYKYWTNVVFVCQSDFTYQWELLLHGPPKSQPLTLCHAIDHLQHPPDWPFFVVCVLHDGGGRNAKMTGSTLFLPFFKFITQSLSVSTTDICWNKIMSCNIFLWENGDFAPIQQNLCSEFFIVLSNNLALAQKST